MAKTEAPKAAKPQTETIVYLDPTKIETGDNAVRYSILPANVDIMKASIVAQGKVNDPIEVTPILDGKKETGRYTPIVGFTRLAAVLALNKEGAGLKIPAIVREAGDAKARLGRQLSENVDRASLSPMDMAVSIKNLLAAGYSKPEICALFPRIGGPNGKTIKPASNAWLNMMLSFLDLSKDIRERVHDGRVNVSAAYALTKVEPEKRAAVLASIEEKRKTALEKEEKEEARLAALEEKAAKGAAGSEAKAKKLEAAEAALTVAEQANIDAQAKVASAREALQTAGKITTADMALLKPEEKKAVGEKVTAAKTDFNAALKLAAEAAKAKDAAQKKLTAIADKAEKPKAEKAEKPAKEKAKPAPISPKDVKTAAKAVGSSAGVQPLTMAEQRQAIATLGGSKFKGAKAISAAVLDCFNGKLSVGSMVTAVEVATGERKTVKA